MSINRILHYFREISQIPRMSGDEGRIGQYLMEQASRLSISAYMDSCGNVIYKKGDGSSCLPLILQAHMDMVWESSDRDYAAGVSLKRNGSMLTAAGTTLGADDGMGVCLILSLMEDPEIPNLEALFTVDEEVGMTGARGVAADAFTGTKLINLDSEIEGVFTISAAGGLTQTFALPVSYHSASGGTVIRLRISGLEGGHSGLDIDAGRLSAIKLLVQWLQSISSNSWSLLHLNGGSRTNAIPTAAEAVIRIGSDQLLDLIRASEKQIRALSLPADSGLTMTCEFSPDTGTDMDDNSRLALIYCLSHLPHGVQKKTPEILCLSCNLAQVREQNGIYQVELSLRASEQSLLDQLADAADSVARFCGMTSARSGAYPPWAPIAESSLRACFIDTYRKLFGTSAVCENVHAGVECSILQNRCPNIKEMISIGPTINGAHTVHESVDLDTVEKVYHLVKNVLMQG